MLALMALYRKLIFIVNIVNSAVTLINGVCPPIPCCLRTISEKNLCSIFSLVESESPTTKRDVQTFLSERSTCGTIFLRYRDLNF